MADLYEMLRQLDEITLLELLGIDSDDLIDAFADRVEENERKIRRKLREDE